MDLALATLLATHAQEGWEHGWWPVWPLLWIGLIVAAVWVFGRRFRERPQNGAERARGILAERYARGEISGDEYRERLEQLR